MPTTAAKGFHLSLQQSRLWAMPGDKQVYRCQCAVSVEGPLNRKVFQQACEQLVRRHTILRSTFYRMPGVDVPLQVVVDDARFASIENDLTDLDALNQATQIKELFQQLQNEPFDIADGPLLRLSLLHLREEQHLLLVSLPAFCADAATLQLLVTELGHIYIANMRNEELADQPLQYVDVSAWQNELLQEESTEWDQMPWHSIDLSQLATQYLPFERSGKPAQPGQEEPFAPACEEITVANTLFVQLRSLAQKYETSLEVLLLACWQILLWRLTGRENNVVGVACEGRAYEELTQCLGLYTRFVPFSISFGEDRSFMRVLKEMDDMLNALREEQYFFTWERVTSSTEVRKSQDNTIFPITFACENWPEHIIAGSLSFRLQHSHSYQERFGLHLQALQTGDHLRLHLHYDTTRLQKVHIQHIVALFSTLLHSAVQRPQELVGRLSLLTDQARQSLLEAFVPLAIPYLQQPWHRQVEAQAARGPDQTAVVCGEQRLSYQQLNEQANLLARYLCELGVGPGVVVGLCLERSVHLLVGVLAVLKAGGAYLPLEPAWPLDRKLYALHETQAPVLLTHRQLEKSLVDYTGTVLDLERFLEASNPEGADNLPEQAGLEDLAYVIYTSGSTGRPKGVTIRQSSLLNYVDALSRQLNMRSRRQWAHVSTIAADLGHTMLFPSLISGGCLHLIPYEILMSGEALARYNHEQGIDVLKIVPTHLQALLTSCPDELQHDLLPREALVLGGEALRWELIDQLSALQGSCRVFNHYGPTEATVGALVYALGVLNAQMRSVPERETGTVPVGRPIANTEAYIVDCYGQLVPIGVTGELIIAGAGLSTGYLQQPEQTALHFIAHPLRGEDARAYRTGDLVRSTVDRQIEYIGRIDSQIKIRGYRIEPGEIEEVLSQHPDVYENVVQVREDIPDNKQLVAYVVMRKGKLFAESELRVHLQAKLPDFMLPAHFVPLSALPLTSNGKVDRGALPAPDTAEARTEVSLVALRSPVEELIAECWRDVLKVKEVGAHDNFFERGGHSLLATQLISRVHASTQVELSLRQFFEVPTIAGLARQIEVALLGGQASAAPPLVPVARDYPLPLSFAQQRLWFLSQLDPDSSAYNKPMAVRLDGYLQIKAFEHSLREIMRRHEILRTTFQMYESQPVQIIKGPEIFYLPYADLSELPPGEQEAEVRHLIEEEARHPFDLARGPLLRILFVRLGQDEQVLLLNMHHIISDGWSNSIFVSELTSLYTAFVAGQPSPLSPLPVQYADFATWQQGWLQGQVLEAHLDYWKEQLGEVAPLALPTDRPRPPIQTFHGAYQASILPLALSQELGHICQREKVTLFMLLLAAFQVLLSRYSGQQEIVVGTPIANRNRAEVEGLIGFFVNTLVLHTSLAGDPTFQEVLGRVRETALGAYAHQDLPFEKLVEMLQPERDLSRSPLFQVMFVLQNLPIPTEDLPGVQVSPMESEHAAAKFDLTLTAMESEEGLVCSLEYNTDLFDHATITRLLRNWQTLLEAIAADIAQPATRIPVLTPTECSQMIVWNDTRTPSPTHLCLHQLFEARVERTPDMVALVLEEGQITYGELNRRANQLARYLSLRGVEAETLVGIYMERSIEMVVALLAILKAGGAYVPLDPIYPKERLSFLMEDASLSILLTQEQLRNVQPMGPSRLTLYLDTDWADIAQEGGENLYLVRDPQALAYVIYTSGSTGRPKGVAICQQSVVNYTTYMCSRIASQGELHFATVSTLAADLGNTVIFCSLVSGGCLHIVPYEMLMSGERFANYTTEHPIDMLKIVPSHLSSLLATLSEDRCRSLLPRTSLILGGEAFSAALARQLKLLHGSCSVWNHYGPTESTIGVLTNELDLEEKQFTWEERQFTIPMGRPIANTQVYVLDRFLQPVPIGVVGELHIGGVGLARGYLGQPALTAEKFIPHPLSEVPGERLYKTGDLGRYRPNGTIEYIGRIDSQVKIRGFRIEPGEIEATLAQYPGLQESAVICAEVNGENRLVAFVVFGEAALYSSSRLRDYLKASLPDYMLPSHFVLLPALPLTANGKVDRHRLAMPERDQRVQVHSRPRNNLEFQLQRIWEETLDQRPLGITDNFFELGGHSLLAVRLMTQIQRQLGQDIALSELFQHPTIAELAILLRQQRGPERWPVLAAIQPNGTKTPFFCVHPAGGTVFHYYALARRLGMDQPFYGLQTPDLDGNGTTYNNLPEMAAHYIAAIRSVQPHGPYLLGGWSLGGVIAFEMAQQLRKQGCQVALLALIDSSVPLPNSAEHTGEFDASDVALARYLIERGRIVISDEAFSALGPRGQLLYILEQGKAANAIPEDTDLVQFCRFERMQFINVHAVRSYVPEVYPDCITLFRAINAQGSTEEQEHGTAPQDLTRGWDKLTAQDVDVHVVQGTHADMIDEPNVASLADALRQCLNEVKMPSSTP